MQSKDLSKTKKSLKALLVQNNPKLLEKKNNISNCRKLLQNPNSWRGFKSLNQLDLIDIVVFPEMAFTGYNFQHYQHIFPLACFVDQGQDFQFARQISKKFDSYVLFGYVQKVLVQNMGEKQKYELFNAAALLDREGKLVLNTRKTHLYFCDQLWSKEGNGFKNVVIKNKQGQNIECTVGICMDINQKNFTSGLNELADHMIKTDSECLLFISNWTDNSPGTNLTKELYNMLNYWLERLYPLLDKTQPDRLFLICDRVGSEYNFYDKKQTWFFGCSGGLNLQPLLEQHLTFHFILFFLFQSYNPFLTQLKLFWLVFLQQRQVLQFYNYLTYPTQKMQQKQQNIKKMI